MEIGAPQYDNSKRALQALQRSDLFEAHDVAPRAQIVGHSIPIIRINDAVYLNGVI